MKMQLNHFIKSAAACDQSKYKSNRNHNLDKDFADFLGFKRWHTPIMRPDCDPKYDYPRWGMSRHAVVKNIRVMTFRNLYGSCIIEISKERNIILPNGWKLAELVETLFQLRREYKSGLLRSREVLTISDSGDYNEWQMIAKYLANAVFGIICNKGSAINMGGHEVIARAREKVGEAINQIIASGGTVLHVNVDEIAYVGKQVDIPNVHHERFNNAVFTGFRGAMWGDHAIISGPVPTLRFDMDDWEPSRHYRLSDEEQRASALRMIDSRRDRLVKELNEYMNKTKEEVLRELNVDCDSISL
ncbi:hypothetical protein KKP3664_000062 [Citrobacter phage KKP_3664]|nr:hypothetical protein KKP3664_000062 [Citrobacter phage KKP_3664]